MRTEFWLENLKARDHSEDLSVDGRMILKFMLGKYCVGCGLVSPASGYGPVVGSCELGNEPSGSIKGGEFLD
jgi:hypothetical protein